MSEGCAVGCEVEVDGELYGRTAEHGRFCSSCYARILYRLNEAPGIMFVLRANLIPLGAQKLQGRITGSHDTPLPLRDDALETADLLYSTLANWVLGHAETMGVRPPDGLLAHANTGKDSQGLPANLTPQEASQHTDHLASWLRLWAPSIAYLPGDDTPNGWVSAKAYHDSIVDIIRTTRNKAGLSTPRPRRVTLTGWFCRHCGENTAELDVPDQGPMVARCSDCRGITPIPDLGALIAA